MLTKEDVEIIQKKFPKFTKVQKCMVNNKDYGIDLSPSAKRWLNKCKGVVSTRKKNNEIRARLDDNTFAKLKEKLKDSNVSAQDYLASLIERSIDE